MPQDDGVVTLGAGGDDVNARLGALLDFLQILLRVQRQLVEAAYAQRGFAPARDFLVHRFAPGKGIGAARWRGTQLAFVTISRADADCVEAVEHIEFGDTEAGGAVPLV